MLSAAHQENEYLKRLPQGRLVGFFTAPLQDLSPRVRNTIPLRGTLNPERVFRKAGEFGHRKRIPTVPAALKGRCQVRVCRMNL